MQVTMTIGTALDVAKEHLQALDPFHFHCTIGHLEEVGVSRKTADSDWREHLHEAALQINEALDSPVSPFFANRKLQKARCVMRALCENAYLNK